MASVRLERVQVQAGVVIVEMSSTIEMSLPAIGFGTDGVIAMSSARQGPDGIATRVTGSAAPAFARRCFPPVVTGALVDGVTVGAAVSATLAARSGPDEASLEPRKFYVALPDADAAAHGQVRVVDESGEDYLYPAARFAEVPLPPGVRRRLLRAV